MKSGILERPLRHLGVSALESRRLGCAADRGKQHDERLVLVDVHPDLLLHSAIAEVQLSDQVQMLAVTKPSANEHEGGAGVTP